MRVKQTICKDILNYSFGNMTRTLIRFQNNSNFLTHFNIASVLTAHFILNQKTGSLIYRNPQIP